MQILDTAVNKAPLGRTVVKKPYPRKFAKIFQPQLFKHHVFVGPYTMPVTAMILPFLVGNL